MSLLDNGPQVVTVFPEIESEDDYGNTVLVPDFENGVEVRGRWQSSTAEESALLGQTQDTVYRFISRTFPAGPYGQVEFEGNAWDVVAAPRHRRGSPTTQHYTTYLKKR